MTQDSVNCDDLEQMHELLLEADVVEGPLDCERSLLRCGRSFFIK